MIQYLRQIRQPYLSTAPPPRRNLSSGKSSQHQQSIYLSDAQRDEIDSSTAAILHDLSRNIQALTQAENLRQQTETSLLHKKYGKPDGLLWRWAAGGQPVEGAPKSKEQAEDEGKASTLKSVRDSVLWHLGRELQRAAEIQREMVEKRINREREKEKSILYKMSGESEKIGPARSSHAESPRSGPPSATATINGPNPFHNTRAYNPATAEDETEAIESQLTPQQLQLFEAENSTLMQHYNDQLSKIQAAEKSLLEISSLQQTLISHLATQGEMIEQLVSDATGTDENVRKGNKELVKASQRSSTARGVFWGSVVICGFLVGWDLVF